MRSANGARERLHVALRAAGDRAPVRPVALGEHAVVVEELGQETRGHSPHPRRVRRPHRGGLRHDQPLHEVARVAARVEELAERGPVAVQPDQRLRLAVEAQQVEQHPVERRLDQMRATREQAVGRGAVVLEVVAVRHGEAHLGRLGRHPELVEQPLEARVVAVVVDDEAGVHVVGLVGQVHPDRVGVSAETRVGLEQRDLVAAAEQVGADQPGDPGADDRDLHRAGADRRPETAHGDIDDDSRIDNPYGSAHSHGSLASTPQPA